MILIKQCNSIQLAHLYEHIFCAHIDALFYKHRLSPYLDYSLIGTTYHKGLIYIDIDFYTDKARVLAKQIHDLEINLDVDMLVIAISQIIAEKERPFYSRGYDAIKQALQTLHERPWQDIDDVEVIDIKGVRRTPGVFYIAKGRPMPAREMTVQLSLDPDFSSSNRELNPLFRQLALFMTSCFEAIVPREYGYYSFSTKNTFTRRKVSRSHTFKIAHGEESPFLLDVLTTCQNTIFELQQYGTVNRLIDELRVVSHGTHPDAAPNFERVFNDTSILVGAKGWKKIATKKNCDLILQKMSIEIKYGRKSVKEPVEHID